MTRRALETTSLQWISEAARAHQGASVNTTAKPKPAPGANTTKPKPTAPKVNTTKRPRSADRHLEPNRDRHSPGYMREYMRRWRAAKTSRPCPLPRSWADRQRDVAALRPGTADNTPAPGGSPRQILGMELPAALATEPLGFYVVRL